MRFTIIIFLALAISVVLSACSTTGTAPDAEKSVSQTAYLEGYIDWRSEDVPEEIWVYCEVFTNPPEPTPVKTFYAYADVNDHWDAYVVDLDDGFYYLYGSRTGWTVDEDWWQAELFEIDEGRCVFDLDFIVTD